MNLKYNKMRLKLIYEIVRFVQFVYLRRVEGT